MHHSQWILKMFVYDLINILRNILKIISPINKTNDNLYMNDIKNYIIVREMGFEPTDS